VEEIVGNDKMIRNFCNMLTHVLRSKILEGDAKTMDYVNNLSKIHEAGILLRKNVNKRLVLENLMLSV